MMSPASLSLALLMVVACVLPAMALAQTRAVTPPGTASQPAGGSGGIALGAAPAGAAASPGAGAIALGAPSGAQAAPRVDQKAPLPAGTPMPVPKPSQAAQTRPATPPSPRIDLVNEQLEANAPMTPAQIARLKAELDRRTQALGENSPASKPLAKPTQSLFQIDLSPNGSYTPPVVRVAPGQGSVVSFVDVTGKPWPIQVADNAAEERGITVQQFGGHQLSIFAKNSFASGNVLVGLKGLTAPITFTIVSGQKATDYSVTLVIPKAQEGSIPPVIIDGQPSLASSDLFDFLLGTPPAGAKVLVVTGIRDTSAWQSGNKIVVRSPALLHGCIRGFRTEEMGVCELAMTPVILGTYNGRYVQGNISIN